jgi:hypothetical protein
MRLNTLINFNQSISSLLVFLSLFAESDFFHLSDLLSLRQILLILLLGPLEEIKCFLLQNLFRIKLLLD